MQPDRGQHREHVLAAVIDEVGLVTVTTLPAWATVPGVELEDSLQKHAAHLMHRRANGHLGGFQVHRGSLLVILAQHPAEQAVYLLGDLLLKERREVFFGAAGWSGSGRASQMASFTSTSSSPKARKRL